MSTTIKGVVSRVLPPDPGGAQPAEAGRVFFRCSDPADLRKIDGSKRVGLDEVASAVGPGASSFKVGDAIEYALDGEYAGAVRSV